MKLFFSVLLIFSTKSLAGEPIKTGFGPYVASGMMVARPLSYSDDKGWVGTIEFEVSYGSIDENSKFLGMNLHISSKDPAIYERFKKLDMNKSYVFKYVKPYGLNPVWNSTHYLVVDILNLKTRDNEMPKHIEGDADRVGTYNPHGERNAVIVEVQRWGLVDKTCTVIVHMGGSKTQSNDPFVNLVIYGEKNCAAVEALLPYTPEVKVSYSQDYIEMWDESTRVIKTIDVLEKVQPSMAPNLAGSSINDIESRLLNNPDFVRRLKQKLAEEAAK